VTVIRPIRSETKKNYRSYLSAIESSDSLSGSLVLDVSLLSSEVCGEFGQTYLIDDSLFDRVSP